METASGVILLDQLEEVQALGRNPARFRPAMEMAVEKAAIPVSARKLIGVLDVSNDEPGKALDPLATTLGVLLGVDMAKSPSVVVLEREQLRHLTAERDLSGLEVKLRASTRLLDVRIKRGQDGGKERLDVTARITEMSGGTAQILKLSEPPGDLRTLRSDLSKAVLEALAAPVPPHGAGDMKAEAQAFHQRAEMLLLHGYVTQALRLAETAYTLDPQNPYFDIIARCCHDIYFGINPSLGSNNAVGYVHAGTLEELNAGLLLAQMHLDASERVTAVIPADIKSPGDLHWGPLFTNLDVLRPMFPLPDPPQTPEQRLAQQLVVLARQEYRLWFNVYREHNWSLGIFNYITLFSGPYLAKDDADYCSQAETAYQDFERELASWPPEKQGLPPPYPDITETIVLSHRSGRVGNLTVEGIRPLVIWLTKQRDPLLRVQGWNALTWLDGEPARQAAALHALDALFRAEPLFASPQKVFYVHESQFQGRFVHQSFLPPNYIYYSFYVFHDADKLGEYTTRLIDELEKKRDPMPLLRWTRETTLLLWLPDKQDLALSLRMQKLLELKPVPPAYAESLGIIEANLKDRIKVCQQRLGLLADTTNRWDSVQVSPDQVPQRAGGSTTPDLGQRRSHAQRARPVDALAKRSNQRA